jgi:hypothetical protein
MEKKQDIIEKIDLNIVEEMLNTKITIEEFSKNRESVEQELKNQYGDGTEPNTGEATFYF